MSELCFLDMDGVLANFVQGAIKAHNRPSPYEDPRGYGVFDMEKLWGITAEEFWKPLEFEGFWEGLEKLSEADKLVDWVCLVFGVSHVCLLTDPAESRNGIPEKKAWVERYYPFLSKNILFGSAKQFLAGPGRYLIDDRDKNIETFNQAGGFGILYPQLWNEGYAYTGSKVDCVISDYCFDRR